MTTRDQVRRAVGAERGEARARRAPSPPRACRSACSRPASARASTCTAPSATRRSAPATWPPSSGATTASCPGAVYTKGFLRNYALYLGLDPDEVLLAVAARARRSARARRPVITVPRPIAAPRQGLTFSPSLVVFALLTVVVLVVRRLPRRPAAALRQAADDRGHRPGDGASSRSTNRTTEYVLRGTSQPGRHDLDRDARAATRTASVPTPTGRWTRERRPAPRPQPVRGDRGRPRDRARSPRRRSACSSPCRSSVIQAPTLTVDQPADGATFENGAIPVQGRTTNAESVVVSATYMGRPTAGPGASRHDPAPPRRARPRSPCRSREDGSFTTPFELTDRHVGDHRHRIEPGGQDHVADAQRDASPSRASTWSSRSRAAAPGSRSGSTARSQPVDRGRRQGLSATARPLTFTGKESVEVRTGSSGVTKFTLNGTSLGALGRQRHPGDVAVRATGRAAADPAPLTSVPADRRGAPGPGPAASVPTCRAAGVSLATAESCTGGLVAHLVTEVPGLERLFPGRVRDLRRRGQDRLVAVPAGRARQRMAPSRPRSPSRWPRAPERASAWTSPLAVTGVAGPDGGSRGETGRAHVRGRRRRGRRRRPPAPVGRGSEPATSGRARRRPCPLVLERLRATDIVTRDAAGIGAGLAAGPRRASDRARRADPCRRGGGAGASAAAAPRRSRPAPS